MTEKTSRQERLSEAVGQSFAKLDIYRQRRKEAVKQYVGQWYSDEGSDKAVPINLMELATNIYLQRLVAHTPQANTTTRYQHLRPIMDRFEIALNERITEMDLGKTLNAGARMALFFMGIVKVAMNHTQVEYRGVLHDTGEPFADVVSLDDWVMDMSAKRLHNCQFMGDRYEMTEDEAVAVWGPDLVAECTAKEDQITEAETHEIQEGSGGPRDKTEYVPRYRFWDIWLPKEGIIQTWSDTGDPRDPLGVLMSEAPWDGVETGPYHILGFFDVDDSTIPLPPVALWRDLHDLANGLFRKLERQAKREKRFTAVTPGQGQDAQTLAETDDGDIITLVSPNSAKELKTGGISQESLGFVIAVKDLFAYLAGNLDLLGGLGPQSDTLGQDQLLASSASMRIRRMQGQVLKWTTGIIRAIGYYLWTDPVRTLVVHKTVPGMEGIAIPSAIPPEARNPEDFTHAKVSIQPYSLAPQSPESKLAAIRTIMGEIIGPYLQLMAQQGVVLDWEILMRTISELGNLPELNEFLVYTSGRFDMGPEGAMQKSPTSHRVYERVNRPGATRPGKDQIMMQALFGGKPQPSEAASLTRATG